MHQIRFQLGLRPNPLAAFQGSYFKGKRRERKKNSGKEKKEGKPEERKRGGKKRGKGDEVPIHFSGYATVKKGNEKRENGKDEKKLRGEGVGESVRVGGMLPPDAEGKWTLLRKRTSSRLRHLHVTSFICSVNDVTSVVRNHD